MKEPKPYTQSRSAFTEDALMNKRPVRTSRTGLYWLVNYLSQENYRLTKEIERLTQTKSKAA